MPQNDTEAVKWYRRSAEEGYADAQISLGLAYQTCRGVVQDNLQADTWYIIANPLPRSRIHRNEYDTRADRGGAETRQRVEAC